MTEEKRTDAAEEMLAEQEAGAIGRRELFSIGYYEYGEAYYGSVGEMRYRVARDPLKNVHFTPPDKRGEEYILAVHWRGPLGYGATPEEKRTNKRFPFTAEGLAEAVFWLNEEERKYRA